MTNSTNSRVDAEVVVIHPLRRLKSILFDLENTLSNSVKGYRVPFSERLVLLATVDSILVLLAVWGAHLLGEYATHQQVVFTPIYEYWQWFPLLLGGWWLLAPLHDLYDISSSYKRMASVMRVISVGMFGLIFYLMSSARFSIDPPLHYFVFWLALALPALSLWRFAYTNLSHVISAPHRILIIGLETRAQAIAQLLEQAPQHYQVLGHINDTPATPGIQQFDLPVLGQMTDLPALVQQLQVDEVVVAVNQYLTADVFQLLMDCQARGAQISWMPNLYEKLSRRIPVQYIDPIWALYAMQGQPIFNRLQRLSKRGLDLVVVLLSLPFFGFLIPLLALAIRLDSVGPVFYRQIRSGRGGKPFSIIKFRTMVTDAEKDGKPRWATEDDPRITRVGRFLRKTRLDELPQIFNILKGDMSIVGPRPERPEFVADLRQAIQFYQVRLTVKPGLTGWAQIHADYGNSVEDALVKLQYDFYYIRRWSLWLDLYTMFKTVYVVLKFKGI